MKHKVSQESSVALVVAPIVTGLLAKYVPELVKGLKSKAGEKSAGEVFKKAKEVLSGTESTDLVRFTQSARVEPILMMDHRCTNVPFIQDVVHSLFNRFTAYWLLAVSLDTKINGVSVGKRLDKFATDRDLNNATRSLFQDAPPIASMESFGLPFIADIVAEQDRAMGVSMEADDDDMSHIDDQMRAYNDVIAKMPKGSDSEELSKGYKVLHSEYKKLEKTYQANLKAGVTEARQKAFEAERDRFQKMTDEFHARELDRRDRETFKKAIEDRLAEIEEGRKTQRMGVRDAAKYVDKITNLAVGNIIDVVVGEDNKEAVVPVSVKLRVAGAPSSVMTEIMAVGGKDASFMSRFRAWRAGEIKFWADFVLAMDRVDAHRAAMMKDESGYYRTVWARDSNNKKAAKALSQGPSVATASSILVLDIKTAKELERKINSTLANFTTRQAIFGQTFSMLIAVVDPDWESVTIYTRGIEMADNLTLKDLKFSGKGDNKELIDMLKGMQLGQAPGGSRF